MLNAFNRLKQMLLKYFFSHHFTGQKLFTPGQEDQRLGATSQNKHFFTPNDLHLYIWVIFIGQISHLLTLCQHLESIVCVYIHFLSLTL